MILKFMFLLVTLGGVSLQQQCYQIPVKALLQVCKYPKGLTVYSQSRNVVVDDTNCGDLQSRFEFNQEPFFQYRMANLRKTYTIITIDPDAPNLENNEVYLHLIRTGISGRALKYTTTCCTNQGNVIVGYQAIDPPPGSGKHRYINLLYINSDGYVVQESDAPRRRSAFNLGAWLQGPGKGLCGPVATITFRSQAS